MKLKVFGVALAILALGVITSIASAAMVLPKFSAESNGTITAGKATFSSGIESITCRSMSGTTAPIRGTNLGTYTFDVRECTLEGEECHSLGDPSGIILFGGEYHLDLWTVSRVDFRYIWFLVPSVHVECKFLKTLSTLQGNFLGTITEKRAGEFEIAVRVREGKQEDTEFENNEGTAVKAGGLEVATDEGKFEVGTLESSENILKTENREVKLED